MFLFMQKKTIFDHASLHLQSIDTCSIKSLAFYLVDQSNVRDMAHAELLINSWVAAGRLVKCTTSEYVCLPDWVDFLPCNNL